MSKNRVLVVCIGNRFRGDDGAGQRVADVLESEHGIAAVRVQTPAELLNIQLQDVSHLVIVDALEKVSRGGEIHRFQSVETLSTKAPWRATHTMSVPEALKLMSLLDAFPEKITVYGIEGESFQPGAGLTDEVEKACRKVAQEIAQFFLR
ncbi:MAG: hydrogenase maturation protease [Candidatus Caldarchaeum sp.]